MRTRLSQMLGVNADELWVATFHSTALRILRRHAPHLGYKNDFNIYDDDDSKSVIKGIIRELKIDEKKYPPSFFMRAIDRAKNNFQSPNNNYFVKPGLCNSSSSSGSVGSGASIASVVVMNSLGYENLDREVMTAKTVPINFSLHPDQTRDPMFGRKVRA